MNKTFLTCLALAAALTSVTAAEVQINIRASGTQANPAIAPDPGGGAVVVLLF